MYISFRLQNFRGFDRLEIDNLSRINLIAGKNNIGKTAILESLFLYMNPYNPELLLRINAIRGLNMFHFDSRNPRNTSFNSLFNGFDISRKITISGIDESLNEEVFTFEILSESPTDMIDSPGDNDIQESSSSSDTRSGIAFQITNSEKDVVRTNIVPESDNTVRYITPQPTSRHHSYYYSSRVREGFDVIAERYSILVTEGRSEMVLEVLQNIEPRLKSLTLLYQAGTPLLSGDIGLGRPIPLIYMGDGVIKVLQYILAIGNADGGVVLIDEIENGLHYKVQKDIWRAIALAAREFDVQVFATTHSLEMIRAAHAAFENDENYDFRFHRLSRHVKTDKIQVTTYDQEAIAAVVELEVEVRG